MLIHRYKEVKVATMPNQKANLNSIFVNCNLYEIDASYNIRRACPKLSNQNHDPYVLIQENVLVDNNKKQLEFVQLIAQESKIVTLAHSILKYGQIHPITVIKNDDAIRKYRNVAGQRRYIAMGLIEALVRLHNDKKLFKQAVDILKNVKYDGDDDACLELNFEEFISSSDQIFCIKAQVAELTAEEAEDIAFEENNETLAMSDLDWGYQFQQMLKTKNLITEELYTLQEIARRRKKHYLFVRGRSALPFLPLTWKEKLDEGSISITKAIEKALELKRKSEDPEIEEEEILAQTGTGPQSFVVENDEYELEIASIPKIGNTTVVLEGFQSTTSDEEDLETLEKEKNEPNDDSELKSAMKKKTRKKKSANDTRLTSALIVELIATTPKTNMERIKAFAEVIQITEEQANQLTLDDVENW